MKKNSVIGLIIAVVLFLAGIMLVGAWFSYNNREISLRKECEAQRGKIEGVYDKMWKVVQQKAQVSSEYKNAFHEIYADIIGGRYAGESDPLLKVIHEANPQFDASLYKDLMQSIEVLRTEFQHSQERMIDLIREHEVLISTYPSMWFIRNKTPIEYTIISSTKSKLTMETGLDDDVSLF